MIFGLFKNRFQKAVKDGILLIDKPKGISSFDVIRILRRKLGIKKLGHAGTLDPAASGLLIIGVEGGTKKLNEFLRLPKTYIMEVLLGKQTDTGDMEGKVIEETPRSWTSDVPNIGMNLPSDIGSPDIEQVKKVLKSMEGEIDLTVPAYSALKLKGKPYYHYARKGIKIDLPKRKTKIYKLKLLNIDKNVLEVEMDCGHGTYARSVGEEIGRRLGYPATLQNLRRTKVGEFKIEDAEKI